MAGGRYATDSAFGVFEYRIEGIPEVTLEGGDLPSDGEDMAVEPPNTPPAWRELSIQDYSSPGKFFAPRADQGVQATISVQDKETQTSESEQVTFAEGLTLGFGALGVLPDAPTVEWTTLSGPHARVVLPYIPNAGKNMVLSGGVQRSHAGNRGLTGFAGFGHGCRGMPGRTPSYWIAMIMLSSCVLHFQMTQH